MELAEPGVGQRAALAVAGRPELAHIEPVAGRQRWDRPLDRAELPMESSWDKPLDNLRSRVPVLGSRLHLGPLGHGSFLVPSRSGPSSVSPAGPVESVVGEAVEAV